MDAQSDEIGIHLSGELYWEDTNHLFGLLESHLHSDDSIIQLDLGKVEAVDTAVLQLLISFKKTVEQHDKQLKVLTLSESVQEAMELIGLDRVFLAEADPERGQAGQILIIDDSRTIRFQVRQTLEENGFSVIEAENGKEALEWLLGRGEKQLPDLILLDRNMPTMAGDECIRVLKADEPWKHIPVLFLTTQNEIDAVVQGLSELQADDYLVKPFDPREMIARVKVLVRIKQAEDQTRDALFQQKRAYAELKQTKIQLAETEAVAEMTKIFEKFVPKQFLSRIAKGGIENIELGTVESETVTTLFTDIRSFTSLAEAMTPNEVFRFLNSYLSFMTSPIEKYGGFVDKFIGDAIMALFDHGNEDDQVTNAVNAAVEMQHVLVTYNGYRANSGYRPIALGSGIHVGHVMIGTLGNDNRMDSTAIGDAVNIASRLESLTKFYHCSTIISEDVYTFLDQSQFICRELDCVYLKGKESAIKVYEILDALPQDVLEKKLELLPLFTEGIAQYYARNWDEAIRHHQACLSLDPHDEPSRILLDRAQQLKKTPPPEDWNGVFRFEHK